MKSQLLADLMQIAALHRTNVADGAIRCKICIGESLKFDIVDFNKFCAGNFYYFGFSGIPVTYYQCQHCSFIFTDFFDDWTPEDFAKFIYNADYSLVDGEYEAIRPANMATEMASFLADHRSARILDYGSGTGVFADRLKASGFAAVENYDPFTNPERPSGAFDIVTCFETIEHSPSPNDTIADLLSFMKPDGCIIFGTSIQPANINELRANWWYIGPRNGHVSIYTLEALELLGAGVGLEFYFGEGMFAFAGRKPSPQLMPLLRAIGPTRIFTQLTADHTIPPPRRDAQAAARNAGWQAIEQSEPTRGNHRVELCSEVGGPELALYDFCVDRPARHRILLLKLDHRGDFLIGLPALEKLRATFPDGHITLVCGSWNTATARDLGVADEIRSYDYFPENSQNWSGDAVEDVDRFREVCKGQFDIAVDLRVDEDTRPLLRYVDATLRCGIGSRTRHPYLNIVLPSEFEARELRSVDAEMVMLPPDAFHSRMPIRTPFFHETDFSVTAAHLIYGPYTRLPVGRLRAEFAFQLAAPVLWPARVRITIEVTRAGGLEVVARKRLQRVPKSGVTLMPVEFANSDRTARYEFRVFVGGHPWRSRLRFFGVRVHLLEKEESGARYLPAELHIGEQLSLLVQLIAERVRPLYPPDLLDRMAGGLDIGLPALAGFPSSAKCIVVAPLSNSTVRDWPLDRYIHLIGMLLAKVECYVVLVGSPDQLPSLSHICHQHHGNRRLVNLGGQIDWSELAGVLGHADLVIANNSGVAHLAAACGRPTLAIYSGSHQPQEWGPRGESVRAVTAAVPCSPCGYERLELCPYDHRCMTLIEPETIFRDALAMLSTGRGKTEGDLDERPVQRAIPGESNFARRISD